jgi:hypothetical protein
VGAEANSAIEVTTRVTVTTETGDIDHDVVSTKAGDKWSPEEALA